MKSLISLLLIFSFSAFAAAEKSYTMKEVAKHNTPKSCWIVIDKQVYDVTPMMEKHNPILKKQCGKDATQGFNTKGGTGEKHTAKALELRQKMKIGKLG